MIRKLYALFVVLLMTAATAGAQGILHGKVTHETDGTPMAGVTVLEKNSTNGTVTDAEGNYSLSVGGTEPIVVFSYLGFETKEIAVNGRSGIDVVMTPSASALSQLVVIGYGTTKKSDLTGSVSSVSAKELDATPATSLDQALQGRAAGVQVTQLSGKPGAATSIRIRGTSSINAGNEPLYVIDGMLVDSDPSDMGAGVNLGPAISPLAAINISDIASIEILKDASATAIYGSRGANGVVIITTKRGEAGRSRIDLNAYYGFQQVAHKIPVLNASEFGDFVNEAKLNAGQTPVYVNPANLGKGTDWQNAIYRTAPISSYQVNFSGGDDKTKFAISGGYFDQDGVVINSDFKRYSFRVNLDRKLSDRVSVGNSMSYARISSTGVLTNAGTIVPGVTKEALLMNPVLPIYNPAGPGGYTYENDRGTTLGNPFAEATEYDSYGVTSQVLGNVYLKYRIIPGLEFKTTFGIDAYSTKENSFGPNFLKRTEASKGEASVGTKQGMTWLNENTLTYNKSFDANNVLKVLAGYTMQQFHQEGLLAYAFDFPDNRTGWHNIGSALNPQSPSNSESGWSMISYLGRINYTLNNKYLFTVNGRVDGSSKFAAGNQYGFFPSGAFAWRVSDEDFMKSSRLFSNLKLRVSYGLIGNQAIPPYQSLALVGPYGQGVFNTAQGSEVFTGKEPLSYVNRNLKWESTRQLDAGIDASVFKGRLSVTADYYRKKTFDLLLSTPIPYTTGFETTLLNVGNIQNQGVDLDLRSENIQGRFTWNTSLNISINRNKVTNLNTDEDIPIWGGAILRKGQPVGTFYGYKFLGIFQSDKDAQSSPVLVGQEPGSPNPASRARAGDRQYLDVTGDGVVNEQDRMILGSAQPKFTWGINNDFSYKGFELTFFIQGSQGNKEANMNALSLLNFTGENNVYRPGALNRWTPDHHSTKYPRALASGSLDVGVFSSAILEDASYARLKNVTLAYRFPAQLMTRLKMSSLRVYVSGTNLATLTKYTGFDPEANTYGQNTAIVGFDDGGYPQAKTIIFGVNIGF